MKSSSRFLSVNFVWLALSGSLMAQTNFVRLKSFGFPGQSGSSPSARFIEDTNGVLYSTTFSGGTSNLGTVFKVNRDGSGYAVLHNFIRGGGDGRNPQSGLTRASDGMLYGTTPVGGTNDVGMVFKLNPDGSGYSVIWNFTALIGDGKNPQGELVEGSDAALYGVTQNGGSNNFGTVYKLKKDGSGYTVLRTFGISGGDGRFPLGGLVKASGTTLCGTTLGTQAGVGSTVYRLDEDGSNYGVLHSFTGNAGEGKNPQCTLTFGTDGAMYGTTKAGGTNAGTVFKINTDGSGYAVLHQFSLTEDGKSPLAGLVEGADGAMYGTTFQGGTNGNNLGTVFRVNRDASGYAVLHSFTGIGGDGSLPEAALLMASDGTFYGTTSSGEVKNFGTIFKLAGDGGGYEVVRQFSNSGGDGSGPQGGLTVADNGTLFGTTRNGGSNSLGAVYRLMPDGSGYSVLHSFSGLDGKAPWAGLLFGSNTMLYGTTHDGGRNNLGTVFRMNQNGSGYVVLYNFTGATGDAGSPAAGLIEGGDGSLYGTTWAGGSAGNGTVFKLNKDGSNYVVLYSFLGSGGDGSAPWARVVEGGDGALYGTTYYGGNLNLGTVFKLNKDGSGYKVLHNFSAGRVDGAYPAAELITGSDGALYGTTSSGGTDSGGTVYKISEDGSGYLVLRSFVDNGADGYGFQSGLLNGNDGALYGTTYGGGSGGGGTVFRLNMDGSGLAVLHYLSVVDGRSTSSSLVRGSDGALYATAFSGGDMNMGAAFKLFSAAPASVFFTGIQFNQAGAQLTLSGAPSQTYRVEASSNLTYSNWDNVTNAMSDPNGLVQFLDANATNFPTRYYRAMAAP